MYLTSLISKPKINIEKSCNSGSYFHYGNIFIIKNGLIAKIAYSE